MSKEPAKQQTDHAAYKLAVMEACRDVADSKRKQRNKRKRERQRARGKR